MGGPDQGPRRRGRGASHSSQADASFGQRDPWFRGMITFAISHDGPFPKPQKTSLKDASAYRLPPCHTSDSPYSPYSPTRPNCEDLINQRSTKPPRDASFGGASHRTRDLQLLNPNPNPNPNLNPNPNPNPDPDPNPNPSPNPNPNPDPNHRRPRRSKLLPRRRRRRSGNCGARRKRLLSSSGGMQRRCR